ncbi:SusC/RagA family TonB-linked outer membrane protein [Olivibacter domesticus]|uniref:TonB-linked outer membrane protein, SusC/RagA family n=1 Tax=Olivibacter domesticus TaxID=407022 RepID=A0A1H7TMR7_OLID1|nr:SusC/RagA family TonB-linked outer membrane protein [Olivibacter domesticus]SEL86140.1 TonB-linked outer membrane protein, SusC/RagA family [Olivibacter domesticus]
MRINYFILLLISLLSFFRVQSQTATLRGKVIDAANSPVQGVSIRIKGISTGTSSNSEGAFTINTPSGATLVITALGYQSQEIPFTGQTQLTIQLEEDNQTLNEVVVTALGIKREKRQLTYSTQEVTGADIAKTKEPNVLNSLTGKVSGVQITSSSGQPGSSSRIVIRGTSSLSGNNEALIVVDGVPINNDQTGNNGNGNGISRFSDIDPAIIESVNVLKGSAASALYGSSAARGVVIVTTKNGSKDQKPSINFTSQYAIDKAIYPEVQSLYAQGDRGIYWNGIDNDQKTSLIWGPRLDTLRVNGNPVRNVNPMDAFFQTGKTYTNTISVQGGTDKSNYFMSYSYLDQEGTVPTTDYKRHAAFAKFSNKIFDKLTANFQFNYVSTTSHRTSEGYGLESPLWTIYTAPFSWDPSPATNEDGTQRVFRYSRNNPFWALENIYNDTRGNRFIPIATFTYNPADWLTITERLGADIYSEQSKYHEAPSDVLATPGILRDRNNNYRQFNHDFIAEARKQIGDDFEVSMLVGNNVFSTYDQRYQITGTGGFTVEDFNNISNTETQVSTEDYRRFRRVSFYAQPTVDYKKMLTLSFTGRMEQSSVFDKENRTYFYGSASGGFVFSELLKDKMPWLSFGKLRASYSKVGNDNVGAYATTTVYSIADNFPFNGIPGFLISGDLGNSNLKNETTTELEIGLETQFLNNRIGLEVNYFDRDHKDLLSYVTLANSTGYRNSYINAGSMYNKGIEALLNIAPVKKENFSWDLTFNFTKIKNRVTALYDDAESVQIGQTYAFKGQPYGTFFASGYSYNDAGQLLIDDTGLPVISESKAIGNIQPDWLAGLNNSITYKNLNLSFFFDMRKGGDLMNSDDRYGFFYGTSKATENREDRVVEGVNINTGETNTVTVSGQDYYQRLSNIYESAIQDGTYVKLRNVSLTYNFPEKYIKRTPFKRASLTATGRNLWIYAPHFTGSDPEVSSYGTGNDALGLYGNSVPTSRSYNFTLSLTF